MNVSVYLFGEFNSGYSQYPDDYTSSIFQKFSANAKSTTQIAIHRDGNLMYYAYIYKLQQDKYIGLCVVLNGLILKRIDGLFSLFGNTIFYLAMNGELLHFNEQGDLVTSVERLNWNRENIELLTEFLRAGFSRLKHDCTSLPAVSYGTSKDSCKEFVVDDDQDEIIKSSYTNSYTYIYQYKGFNTAQLNSYKKELSKSYKEKVELQRKLNALERKQTEPNEKIILISIVLFTVFLICVILLYKEKANYRAEYAKRIEVENNLERLQKIADHQSFVANQIEKEKAKRIKLENTLNRLQKRIADRQPFIVKSTEFNFNSGYLTIEYYGMMEGTVEIQVRAFNDNGESYSNSSSIYVHKGDNIEIVYLSSMLNSRVWYSFEILKDNVILGGDRH